MKISVLTLFPGMFTGPLTESILKRAVESGIVTIALSNIRDFTHDKHNVVDDTPYGGGPGMLMKPAPLAEAIEVANRTAKDKARVIHLSPQGRVLTQGLVKELAREKHLILVCGHYEGVDERAAATLFDDEVSIGDYVLTGGEPAAWVLIDAVVRLLPGALGDPGSPAHDTFSDGLIQYPQYTRPPNFNGMPVPDVLLSGDHRAIAKWRRRQSILRTLTRRPDLLEGAGISPEEVADALRWASEQKSDT
ncbi:MAG: tRNA (guanosine(37)-N1)-methyltransferase TrmD [Chloroflexi bacterium]|nr:tRNA (guanosine(37)-N1)-methyltransferase TrmD [Chloroflexota bacterium]